MTRLRLLFAHMTLGACAPPEALTDARLASEAAAPPGANPLAFEIDGILEPGSPITFRVSGAAANARVHLVRGVSWRFNALCPPALGGLCLDVVQPQIFNTVQADAQGVATLTTVVPNLPDMTKVFFQAVTSGGNAATSAVIPKWNPMPDQAGQAHLTLSSVVTVSPGSYVGVRLERYYADAAPAMDVCSIRYDVSGTGVAPLPPCPSCDFVFNVTHANPTETYSLAITSDNTVPGALAPADRAAIDFFAMQAYSHAYRGGLYVDWIGFKTRGGTVDTVYTFNEKAPEEGTGNINSIKLVPVASVATDDAWLTSTTSTWGTTRVAPRAPEASRSLRLTVSQGLLRASFHAESQGSGVATLRTLDGVVLWSRQVAVRSGANVLDIPAAHRGTALLTIRGEGLEKTGKVVLP